jgi:hypothetical protein
VTATWSLIYLVSDLMKIVQDPCMKSA